MKEPTNYEVLATLPEAVVEDIVAIFHGDDLAVAARTLCRLLQDRVAVLRKQSTRRAEDRVLAKILEQLGGIDVDLYAVEIDHAR